MNFNNLIKEITKIDDHTVKFTLNYPETPFLKSLGMAFASIYSAEYADQLLSTNQTSKLNNYPIGTGPFIFERYSKDAQIRYKTNDKYFKGKPEFDQLIFAITPDPNVRIQRLKANECHIAQSPKPDQINEIKEIKSIKIKSLQTLSNSYIAINTTKKYLNNPITREALNLLVDKEKNIISSFGSENASLATNIYPSTLIGFNTKLSQSKQNIVRAKELLKKANVPEGTKFTYFTRNSGSSTNPNPLLLAQLLQNDFYKAGLILDVKVMDHAELLKRAQAGEHDLVGGGWHNANGDPDNFVTPLLGCHDAKNGKNYAKWCHPEFESLINEARKTQDTKQRDMLYQDANEIFDKEKPWIHLSYPKYFMAMQNNISNLYLSPLGKLNFASVKLN